MKSPSSTPSLNTPLKRVRKRKRSSSSSSVFPSDFDHLQIILLTFEGLIEKSNLLSTYSKSSSEGQILCWRNYGNSRPSLLASWWTFPVCRLRACYRRASRLRTTIWWTGQYGSIKNCTSWHYMSQRAKSDMFLKIYLYSDLFIHFNWHNK